MAWHIDSAALQRSRDEALRDAADEPGWDTYERAGRAERWLDSPDSERWFRRAADFIDRKIERKGRGDAEFRAHAGGLLMLAADAGAARPWLKKALKEVRRDDEPDVAEHAALLYLLGLDDELLELLADHPGEEPLLEALATARSSGDAGSIPAAREQLVEVIRGARDLPGASSGEIPWNTWDWLEETFAVQGRTLSHEQILGETGLVAAKARPARRRSARLPRPRTLVQTMPDGDETQARLEVSSDGSASAVLDPREGSVWSVDFLPAPDGYTTGYKLGSDAGSDYDDKGGPYESFDAAADGAADWLRAVGAPWAAHTLTALVDRDATD